MGLCNGRRRERCLGSVMAERRERGREAVEERERKWEKRIRWAQQR